MHVVGLTGLTFTGWGWPIADTGVPRSNK